MTSKIPDEAVRVTTGIVYAAQWGQISPEQAAQQIMEHLNPTTWPRLVPSYGTTGTRRTRKATKWNARDELAAVLERAYDLNPGMASFELLAHATLAAGYSKPRTITTAEELDALASEVVILDANHVPREGLRGIDGARNYWRSMGPARMLRSYEIPLPATVLYEPQS